MKYSLLFCFTSLLFLALTCKRTSSLESTLMNKTWLHSFEEDRGDTLVYRPNTYEFAPSRGRTGFTLEPGGVVKEYVIAPTDGLEEQTGSWQHKDKDTFHIHIKGNGNASQRYSLEILSLEEDLLKVRKQPLEE